MYVRLAGIVLSFVSVLTSHAFPTWMWEYAGGGGGGEEVIHYRKVFCWLEALLRSYDARLDWVIFLWLCGRLPQDKIRCFCRGVTPDSIMVAGQPNPENLPARVQSKNCFAVRAAVVSEQLRSTYYLRLLRVFFSLLRGTVVNRTKYCS